MLHHFIGQVRCRLLEPELTELAGALSKALSAAIVIAPRKMLPVLGDLTELMGQVEEPPSDWWAEWDKARAAYFVQSLKVVGSDGHRWRRRWQRDRSEIPSPNLNKRRAQERASKDKQE